MNRSLIAATLIATFLVAGCGATPGSVGKVGASVSKTSTAKTAGVIGANTAGVMTGGNTASVIGANTAGVIGANTAGIVAANSSRLGPSVGLIRGAEEAPTASGLVSSLRLVAHHAMADTELQDDAESQGYNILANDHLKPFTKTGFVRRTETGFMMEGRKGGFFSKKEKDNYTLVAGTTAITTQLNARVDAKALIKGLIDKDNVVQVTSVKGLADMGFLTNWFTKGKIVGTVKHAGTKGALDGVKISCKSEDGALFTAVTDEDGEFSIKSLTPGKYFLKLSKEGYQPFTATEAETVEKRDKAEFEGLLAPIAAAN